MKITNTKIRVILAIAVILPIVIFISMGLRDFILNLFNPCFSWGNVGGGAVVVSTSGPCTSAGGSSDTIAQTLLGLALISGVILTGSILGVIGAVKGRPTLCVIGAVILFVESVPLVFGGLIVFTLLPAGFFLWVARTKTFFHPS